jgi:hypothetical protein
MFLFDDYADWDKLLYPAQLSSNKELMINVFFQKLPPYTLAGFDLTTHSSSLLGGRRWRYHYVCRPRRQGVILSVNGVARFLSVQTYPNVENIPND